MDVILFGAEAKFFAAPGLPVYENGVIDLDALEDNTLLGYIYGGIAADAAQLPESCLRSKIERAFVLEAADRERLFLLVRREK